jgi:flagellar motor switch protein FliG
MQSLTLDQLSPAAAQVILAQLPDRIRQAVVDRAAEIEYPVEAILEMAIAGYLDSEAIGFADCKPNRGKL